MLDILLLFCIPRSLGQFNYKVKIVEKKKSYKTKTRECQDGKCSINTRLIEKIVVNIPTDGGWTEDEIIRKEV